MNRTGLLIALAVAVLVGVPFGIDPMLDIDMAGWFYDPDLERFPATKNPVLIAARDSVSWIVALIAAPAVIALANKLLWPRRPMLMPPRAALLMVITLVLAPGILANVVLKDYWGRPRPIHLGQYSGQDAFAFWWDPRGDCPKNCSFVAGEPAGAFWTLAPAAVAPAPWRAAAYAGALTFGAAVGLLRMAAGGHFFTDVVFAGVFTFLIIWVVHGLIYRWRATRFSDQAAEAALERTALAIHEFWTGVFAKLRPRR